MAEWVDSAKQWTDLLTPEWEGDLSVPIGSAVGLSATIHEVSVRVDCSISLEMDLLTLSAEPKTSSVSFSSSITVNAAITMAVSGPLAHDLTIQSSVSIGSAIAASFTVPAHFASYVVAGEAILLHYGFKPKAAALTIVSEIQVPSAFALSAASLEPPFSGVVTIAEASDLPTIASTMYEADLTIDPVYITPDSFSLTFSINEPTVEITTNVVIAEVIALSAVLKAAAVRVDVTVSPDPIGLELLMLTGSIDCTYIMPAALPLAAAVQVSGLTYNKIAAISAAIQATLIVNEVQESRSPTVEASAIILGATMKASVVSYDANVTCAAVAGALTMTLKDPAGLAYDMEVAVSGPTGMAYWIEDEVAVEHDYYLAVDAPIGISVVVGEHGLSLDHAHGCGAPIGTMAITLNEPAAIPFSSMIVVDTPLGLVFGAVQAEGAVDVTHTISTEEAGRHLVLTVLAPEYSGALRPEMLYLNSYITRELTIDSDIDIRMTANE